MSQRYITKQRAVIFKDTGEETVLEEFHKTAFGRKQFWKLYLSDFLQILGLVMENKQLSVLVYILENTSPVNNLFLGTYREIANATNISIGTVNIIMKKLKNTNYRGSPMIKQVRCGNLMISPALLMKGSDFKKKTLLVTWEQLPEKDVEAFANELETLTTV